MRSIIVWEYIAFGTAVRYLQDAKAGRRIHGDSLVLYNAERFLEELDELGLSVTKRASDKLLDLVERLRQTDIDAALSTEQASALSRAMTDIRKTLAAESSGFEAYIATDKRYSIEKLTSNVWSLFHPEVGGKIPDISRFDFEEAGKLIAFERSTGAAFHLMRGVEGVLKVYYCKKKKRNRAALMWGPMTNSLRQMRQPPPTELLDHLDHVRRSFRNPTQHPEKIYDIQEVQDLLSLSIDLVNRMATEL